MGTAIAVARSAPSRRVGTLDNQLVYWVGVKRFVKGLSKKDGWSQARIADELDLSHQSLHMWIRAERLPLTVAKALIERFAPERAESLSARWLVEPSPRRPMASSKKCEQLADAFASRVMIRPISSAKSAPKALQPEPSTTVADLTREIDALLLTNARLVQERSAFARELLAAKQQLSAQPEIDRLTAELTKLREENAQWISEVEAAVTRAENAEAVLAASKIIPCAESITEPQPSAHTLARAEQLGLDRTKLDLGAELAAIPK